MTGRAGVSARLEEALEWLDGHVNLEAIETGRADATPTLERVRRLTELMGDPQRAYPVVHLTGTNGKGSTARMLTSLFGARGLRVGTYTSPHLERINERLTVDGDPIADDDLAEVLAAVAALELWNLRTVTSAPLLVHLSTGRVGGAPHVGPKGTGSTQT